MFSDLVLCWCESDRSKSLFYLVSQESHSQAGSVAVTQKHFLHNHNHVREASNRKRTFIFRHYLRPWPFIQSSTKAGWLLLKAHRKQAGFGWKLYESRMAFVESSMKAGWLLFKALWKPFKTRVNRDKTKFRDKIAYVGGPSFRRRPWPFGERCSRNFCHPAFCSHLIPLF